MFLTPEVSYIQVSNNETQRDDIEFAIASYVEEMNKELYAQLAKGREEYLCNHTTFDADMQEAINELETRL